MPQSLFTLWLEAPYIDNKIWVLGYLQRLNPVKVKILTYVRSDGGYDFSFADDVRLTVPSSEVILRPYATDENQQWESIAPEAWILDKKAKLAGRPFRITFGCEPAFRGQKLTDFLAYNVKLMEAAHKHNQPVDLWGIQPQLINKFTQDADDIDKGKWDAFLKVAGELRGIVTVDYHTYTGLVAPAGTFDDTYLRRIASEQPLLSDPLTWATWKNITDDRPYQTRHLFRHRWLNLRALEKGYQEHDYFLGESLFDRFEEWDLGETWQRADAIAGKRVTGINTLEAFYRWKFPQWTFKEAVIHQLVWYGSLLSNDPRCKGFAAYMYSSKEGDQAPYNFAPHKDILDGMVGLTPIHAQTPTTPPVTPPTLPPVVTLPPVIPPPVPAIPALPFSLEWESTIPGHEREFMIAAKNGTLTGLAGLIMTLMLRLNAAVAHIRELRALLEERENE